ncbi:hypothetical protein H6F95_31880 [Cyanobacteria bacterium FACHB-471]|nr:hypothetical protein [Cyanobacteria bacterium FACHB-471]
MIQIPLQTSNDVDLIADQLYLYAHTKGCIECAAAIRRSIPEWADETYRKIVFHCESKYDAELIKQQANIVKLFAKLRGLTAILVKFPGARTARTFSAAREGDDLTVIPPLSSVPAIASIQLAHRMCEAGQQGICQALVHHETDWQLFVTQPLADLLGMSIEEASHLNVRPNWVHDGVDDGLAEMKQLLKQKGIVQLAYRTQLKPGHVYDFISRFELVLDGRFRLTTILSALPVEVDD